MMSVSSLEKQVTDPVCSLRACTKPEFLSCHFASKDVSVWANRSRQHYIHTDKETSIIKKEISCEFHETNILDIDTYHMSFL